MPHVAPEFNRFTRLVDAHADSRRLLVPMVRRLFADALTPVLAYRRLVRPDPRMAPSFLLESVVGGERIARYSFMGAQPIFEVIAREQEVEFRDHRHPNASRRESCEDPLAQMARMTDGWSLAPLEGLPDFTGGWVGYAAYDSVRYLERDKLPFTGAPADDRGLPDLHMQLYTDVVAFDHVSKTILVITHVMPDEHDSLRAAYDAGSARLDELVERLIQPLKPDLSESASDGPVEAGHRKSPSGPSGPSLTTAPRDRLERFQELPIGDVDLAGPVPPLPPSNMGEGGYQHAVRICKAHIAAGDAFQIVPSQRFELTTSADPFDLYRALRVVNPSPYMFYLQVEGAILVGSSPEILCRVEGDKVTSRPLAGTRRRGHDDAEDQALERELLADAKDVAEHVMLVDLHRNDVGRVAVVGSVEIPEVLTVERFSHVMHISSQVVGKLRPGASSWDVLRVSLPVGTVSGAPKVRAMQIIDELEPTRRGPYAGAVGYVDFAGNMDMAIALRTMVVRKVQSPESQVQKNPESGTMDSGLRTMDSGLWTVHIQAGGGIVADSDPDAEHQETLNKAAALAKAVDLAQKTFVHSP